MLICYKKITVRLAFLGNNYFPCWRNSFLLEWSIFISLCNQHCANFYSPKHLSVRQDNSYTYENYASLIKYECKVSEYPEIHIRKWCTKELIWRCCDKLIDRLLTWEKGLTLHFFLKRTEGRETQSSCPVWKQASRKANIQKEDRTGEKQVLLSTLLPLVLAEKSYCGSPGKAWIYKPAYTPLDRCSMPN